MSEPAAERGVQKKARERRLLVVAVAAGVGTVVSSLVAMQKQLAVVRLEADPAIIDLGRVLPEESYPVVFRARNTGTFSVEIIAVHSSCACTVARLKPTIIEPGDSLELPAEFSTGKNTGTLSSRITLIYRRPSRNTLFREDLRVTARVMAQPSGQR